ncbi:MAG: hypothetical protein HY000_37270 [Planctomycetes bacterium]|nr:hypothetical protein [Planctomycetota bacterium]
MPISVACKCGKKFQAPDNLAGKRVKCPGCQQLVVIPAPQVVADPEFVKWFMEELAHENQADLIRKNRDQPAAQGPPKAGMGKKKKKK